MKCEHCPLEADQLSGVMFRFSDERYCDSVRTDKINVLLLWLRCNILSHNVPPTALSD